MRFCTLLLLSDEKHISLIVLFSITFFTIFYQKCFHALESCIFGHAFYWTLTVYFCASSTTNGIVVSSEDVLAENPW